MIPKLSTGEFLHTVKMYIFITNEYGKPTEDSIDLFIESFGALLLNKDFAIYDRVKNELNTWWSKVEQDLNDRQLQSLIKYTGGFEWFKQLTIESKTLTKEQEEQFRNDKSLFKEWIYNVEVENNEEVKDGKHEEDNMDILENDWIKSQIHELSDIAKRRKELILINRKNTGEILEELKLYTDKNIIEVYKSRYKDLEIPNYYQYKSFEQYLLQFIMLRRGRHKCDEEIQKEFIHLMNNIKQGKLWEVQIGTMYKPMNIIFKWEDNKE